MKRFVYVSMACFMLAGCLNGCGSNSDNKVSETTTVIEETQEETSENEGEVNKVSEATEEVEETEEVNQFEVIHFGDSIVTDFLEMTVDEYSTSQELKPTDTSGVYSYMSDNDGETYFYLKGTMKNVSGDSYSVEEMNIQLTFDDKYNYTGYIAADDGGNDFYGDYVKPFGSVKYYMYASVPDELLNSYSTCTVKFAFHDNFKSDYKTDFSLFEYCYIVNIPDDGEGGAVHSDAAVENNAVDENANEDSNTGEFITVNFGDSITTEFLEMTVDGASTSQELKPSDTSGVYSYKSDNDGETYFYLTGTMKNIGGDAYSVEEMNIQLTFDDKYNYTGYIAADDGGNDFYGDYVKPFGSVKYYMYASIPDELINSYSTCTIKFGFHDNFKSDYKSDFSVYEHCYTIALTK